MSKTNGVSKINCMNNFKKLFIVIGLLILSSNLRSEELRPQFRVWRSSQIQTGVYNNVLLSSSPIVFHVLNGSAAVNQGGNQYFSIFWSTTNPPTTDMSTKAFIPLNQSGIERSGLGFVWDTPITSTGNATPVYTFYSKQGGAGPLFIEWDIYKYPASPGSPASTFWKD